MIPAVSLLIFHYLSIPIFAINVNSNGYFFETFQPRHVQSYMQFIPSKLTTTEPTTTTTEEPQLSCTAEEQEKVRQCADPLYRIGAITEDMSSLSWQRLLTVTRQYFAEVCDHFFVFDLCIEPYKDTCFSAKSARFRYDAAIKVLDFVCRDGYREVSRNLECFTRTLSRAEMMQCQSELITDTRKAPDGDESRSAKDASICGAMRNYMECVKYPIRYECGYRAWQLAREAIARPTSLLLPQCHLNSSNANTVIFALIMSVVVALLL